jgi:hypothetical protein
MRSSGADQVQPAEPERRGWKPRKGWGWLVGVLGLASVPTLFVFGGIMLFIDAHFRPPPPHPDRSPAVLAEMADWSVRGMQCADGTLIFSTSADWCWHGAVVRVEWYRNGEVRSCALDDEWRVCPLGWQTPTPER